MASKCSWLVLVSGVLCLQALGCDSGDTPMSAAEVEAAHGADDLVTLEAVYAGDAQPRFAEASAVRLGELLMPGDEVRVAIDGDSLRLNEVRWSEVLGPEGGQVLLEAHAQDVRPLAWLDVAVTPASDAPAGDHAVETDLAASSQPTATHACRHGSFGYRCTGCRGSCPAGQGFAQRTYCAFGTELMVDGGRCISLCEGTRPPFPQTC